MVFQWIHITGKNAHYVTLRADQGSHYASTTAKSLKMRQINSCINHFEIELNLTLLEAGIYQAGIQEICFCKNGAKTMN